MPDWFYRTIAQPVLFALPGRWGRGLALGVMGTLGRTAPGRWCIDLLGHMRAPSALARDLAGVRFATPVGIGRRVDPTACAGRALARFGVGCIEFGPVGAGIGVQRDGQCGLLESAASATHSIAGWRQRLRDLAGLGVPRLVRLAPGQGALAAGFGDGAELFIVTDTPPATERPVLRAWRWDEEPQRLPGFAGVVLDAERPGNDGQRHIPLTMPAELPARVRAWRAVLGDEAVLAVSGGVATPADAVQVRMAGADLLLLEAGLVFTGPGLPKRINQALLGEVAPPPSPLPAARRAWFWSAALGASMLGGGLLALVLALTRVVLPYDEHYLGMTRAELAERMPRLLAFMAHDRVTLAGVMLALGVLYLGLASAGVRRGQHHAQIAVVASGLTGFASFFWFLGFGYFDPFHAFVSAVLVQLLLLALVLDLGQTDERDAKPDLGDDPAWRRALWGQLLLVVHSAGLLFAGALISVVGMTQVFVAEDLGFLCLTRDSLEAVNARIIPVVAHDRASLGGMLLACGVGLLLPVLWGWRRGRAWLWWTILGTGIPAYTCAIGIHWWVGYTDWQHLLPAVLGAGLWAVALWLSHGYLVRPGAP